MHYENDRNKGTMKEQCKCLSPSDNYLTLSKVTMKVKVQSQALATLTILIHVSSDENVKNDKMVNLKCMYVTIMKEIAKPIL